MTIKCHISLSQGLPRRSTVSSGCILNANSPQIRPVEIDDYLRIVDINASEVLHTSPMDLRQLHLIAAIACYLKVAVVSGQIAGFLMALRDHVTYQNANYKWFADRLDEYIYVDRIVVAVEYTGLKIGSLLYSDLFAYARLNGITNVTCEYNIAPPNLASAAFHKKFGFAELGTQWVAGGAKLVSLQVAAA